ncbi:MAG: hypothetical protein WDM88_12125 [Galbitalea sp.]
MPNNRRVTLRLAGSDPFQDELGSLLAEENLQLFIAARTIEEERTDAPMPVASSPAAGCPASSATCRAASSPW